ncbi:PREDICTED: cyclin-dependent kinase inhibitor 1C-like [Bactrocera latifrons]|uniref:cyclin-dependent kinase inhibitor 1C-like n=1 Tax=Bactrocera latifrons TaxID=174628 RepID=UPI0008DD7AE8|nr:PREDICTED: cyclin-dependent kinase inhibitor 1C-like [Bactrocera latifrons]
MEIAKSRVNLSSENVTDIIKCMNCLHDDMERGGEVITRWNDLPKFFAAATFTAILALACADVSHLGYGYDQPAASAPFIQYIPPAANALEPAYAPAPAPVLSYIPPAANVPEQVYAPAPAPAPVSSYIPPAATAPEPVYSAPAPASVYAPQQAV